ncbi:MAG: ABC transporter ATP-binding protein [Canibacter sp.]
MNTNPEYAPTPGPQDPEQLALAFRGLGKHFGQKIAVNNLTLAIPLGTMFGLVGPNGAGKTTALSMATGILRPNFGEVSVLGQNVWSDPVAAKSRMGVLPDGLRTYDRLTGPELLRYTGLLRGIPEHEIAERSASLIHTLGLAEAGNSLVVDYSAGMKKKVGLAAALIHSPKVLILDEPFEAVDPVSSQIIRALLRQIVARGGTVVLSSHVMELVEQLCDQVAVIHQGQLIATGTVPAVQQGKSLQDRFVEMVGGGATNEGLEWLG